MFDRIDTLRTAENLIAHGTERQRLIATNVAHADTPGYKARDLLTFAPDRFQDEMAMKRSNPRHLGGTGWGLSSTRPVETGGEPSPNGNTVSIEDEVFRMASAKREFETAIAVTRSSLSLLRTSLGRRA